MQLNIESSKVKIMKNYEELKEKITKYIEENMSDKRKTHTEGVRSTAIELAEKYGADVEKAELCSLFHDMYRGVPEEDMNNYVRELGLGDRYLNNRNLAHGKVAAIAMKRDFGVQDEDMLNAVSYHTTGRAGMSTLEKVIYLADAIEPNRDYPSVDELRRLAKEDLDKACLACLEHTIEYVKQQGAFLDEDTLEATKYLRKGKEMTNRDYALLAAKTLSNKKALDIVVIDIQEKASFADYFVVCSGTSERQIQALTDDIEELYAQEGLFVKSIEGKHDTGWILMDFGDIIVNLFTKEMREKYSIEKIWGDCTFLEIEE